MLRYAKGKTLKQAIGEWQSAFLSGYLQAVDVEEGADPEHGLCVTLNAYSGTVHPAPTDSKRRFRNMEAACKTIVEWWPNITPPPNSVI